MKQRQRGIGMTFWKYLIRALEVASQTSWFYSLGFCFAETVLSLSRPAAWWYRPLVVESGNTHHPGRVQVTQLLAWIPWGIAWDEGSCASDWLGGALRGRWGVRGSRTGTGEAEHGVIKPQAWHAACCACNNAPPVVQSGEVSVGECARITQKWWHTKKWAVSGTTSCPWCC